MLNGWYTSRVKPMPSCGQNLDISTYNFFPTYNFVLISGFSSINFALWNLSSSIRDNILMTISYTIFFWWTDCCIVIWSFSLSLVKFFALKSTSSGAIIYLCEFSFDYCYVLFLSGEFRSPIFNVIIDIIGFKLIIFYLI